jgi:hypothetical protein
MSGSSCSHPVFIGVMFFAYSSFRLSWCLSKTFALSSAIKLIDLSGLLGVGEFAHDLDIVKKVKAK